MSDKMSDVKTTIRKYFADTGDDGDQRSWRELSEVSTRDPLTGGYNRRYMDMRLSELKPDDKFCVVMVDVDHFKSVNDRHGHQVGDEVLKHVYSLLNSNVRSGDMVARYGGEEFLILLKDYDRNENVSEKLEMLRSKIEATPHNNRKSDPAPIKVTASLGYVFSDGKTDPTLLVTMADKALYEAKAAGRNRVVVAE